jgi:hypothetical protein
MNDHFRIGLRSKLMAKSDQPLAKFPEVIDFAVECNPNGTIFIAKRLSSSDSNVNYCQACMPKDNPTVRQALAGSAIGSS